MTLAVHATAVVGWAVLFVDLSLPATRKGNPLTRDRAARVWSSIAEHARREGAPVSLRHVCLACAETVPVDGAALVLGTTLEDSTTVFATDALGERLAELERTCGEGPTMDALTVVTSVLVDDLTTPVAGRAWPAYAPEATRLGVAAAFALPLRAGAICAGALDLYRTEPGPLGPEGLADALLYAGTALALALEGRMGLSNAGAEPARHADAVGDDFASNGAEVHQAAGMVSVQLGVSVTDALVRLRAHAYANSQRLGEIAHAVVDRRLSFPPDKADPTTLGSGGEPDNPRPHPP
jgi:hypothetical protein